MRRTDDELAHTEAMNRYYREAAPQDVLLEIEREILGGDYGGTSWTNREEAERFAHLLRLAPGVEVLDLGAGAGWPGLYLARRSGCRLTMVDLPREGLRMAMGRAVTEGLSDACRALVGEGARLPFAAAQFDAVYHCDVLC